MDSQFLALKSQSKREEKKREKFIILQSKYEEIQEKWRGDISLLEHELHLIGNVLETEQSATELAKVFLKSREE